MNRIREFREQAQMTREDLAAAVGRKVSAISHYENQIRKPDLEMSRAIVAVLNKHGAKCSLDDVFPPDHQVA